MGLGCHTRHLKLHTALRYGYPCRYRAHYSYRYRYRYRYRCRYRYRYRFRFVAFFVAVLGERGLPGRLVWTSRQALFGCMTGESPVPGLKVVYYGSACFI
jgi:hypothetical protein